MASPQSAALKHWTRIIKQWPVDKVRPESVSFQRIMQQRIQGSPNNATSTTAANKADVPIVQPRTWDEQHESKQAKALDDLLSNRFSSKFPVPATLRQPASNPTYYDDLVKEMDEAPTRSWFSNVVKRVKGSFRLT